MKKMNKIILAGMAVAISGVAAPTVSAAEITGWGDFKLYIDPGHEGRSNRGLWGFSEAEKVLDVALNIKQMLETYTDMPAENLKLCRYTESDVISLEERSDEANAWGADFYYSIHSDAGAYDNLIVTLFGGWRKDGVEIEKTPNGGKAYGEILNPNMASVMRVGTRGNWYDRCFYDREPQTHENQFPYLSVNRRSNMPSLLSEGAYHTIAYQQARNMNPEYRRLEALAAFQSLLKYHGLNVPAQTFLHGEVYNSENEQRINGATVTVNGKTYTTDTWEKLFNKYTTNPDLIHNGLYTFEGLEAGKEYEVRFEAPGFETKTAKVTIKAGGANTGDYVTFLDMALTNTAPAKIDAISIADPTSVSPLNPVTITFSRKMDRESVEKAFSINNDGVVKLTWTNDYTLVMDISELLPLWDYTLTIDGSIAKNSQTGLLFDGDADGQPGGNWEYTFTMAEPDLSPAEVVSTYPAADGEVTYTEQFPIRIEFNEILNWNDDTHSDCITVTDAAGTKYAGTTTHAIIGEHSVLHFFPAEKLPKDKTFLVTVAAGLPDLSGNSTESPYYLRFMTEYRNLIESTVMLPCEDAGTFWAPGGSGSSAGLIVDESTTTSMPVAPFSPSGSSMSINYVFDENATPEDWFIRLHNPQTNNLTCKDFDVILTYWIYSDGSNNEMNMLIRIPNAGGGLKNREGGVKLDFRGWGLYTWDLMNDPYQHFTGEQVMGASGNWRFDAITMRHLYTDPDDPETPFQAWTGSVGISTFAYSKWDNNAERQAKIDDVTIPENSVNDVVANDVKVNVGQDIITVIANSDIESANVYAVNGMLVGAARGNNGVATVSTACLENGVYVVKVVTAEGVKTVKFVK